MFRLELTHDEQLVLAHALESYLSDLHFEIAKTDRTSMKQSLKAEEATLRRLFEVIRREEKQAA